MLRTERVQRKLLIIFIVALIISAAGLYYYYILLKPQAPERTEWAYDMIEVTTLNDNGFYGAGITVAIIDSGIDLSHPEFERYSSGEQSYIWRDYVSNNPEPYDDNGHGTAMAGLIAGKNYGVAPRVDLIIVKTITADGSGEVDNIERAIKFAVNNGADVISLSLGGGRFPIIGTDAETEAENAITKGVFVIAAAGNDGENDNGDVDSPSNVDLAISVGSVDENGRIAKFSSRGDNDGFLPIARDDRKDPNKKPEIVAPGVDIKVPMTDDQYGITSGTSVSTAFVSGLVALTLEANKGYERDEKNPSDHMVGKFKEKLMESASPAKGQSSHSHDDWYGYGIIKGYRLSKAMKESG